MTCSRCIDGHRQMLVGFRSFRAMFALNENAAHGGPSMDVVSGLLPAWPAFYENNGGRSRCPIGGLFLSICRHGPLLQSDGSCLLWRWLQTNRRVIITSDVAFGRSRPTFDSPLVNFKVYLIGDSWVLLCACPIDVASCRRSG